MEPTATPEAAATTNGKAAEAGRTVEVDNPATGKLIGTVPAMGPDEVTAAVERARDGPARLGGARLRGARRGSCAAPRSGRSTTPSGSSRRSSPRPARPTRTRSSPRSPTPPTPSASGPRTRPSTSPTRRSSRPTRSCWARSSIVRYRAARRRRRDRPVELPADELLRRLHPGAGRRQRGRPQAERGHAADLAADGRGPARVRPARGRLPGRRPASGDDRRRADRRRST